MRKLTDECRVLKANLSLYEGYEVGSVAGIELIKCNESGNYVRENIRVSG